MPWTSGLIARLWQMVSGVIPGRRYDPCVSNVPAPPPVPPPWSPVGGPPRQPSRWVSVVSLVIALVAVGCAIAAWLRPVPKYQPPAAPTYSSQQVADAKTKVCAAYTTVHHAVLANTGRSGDDDPATQLGLAANARIALFDSGDYLLKVLAREPAAAAALREATQALADSYQQLALDYMAEASDSNINRSRQAIETTGSKVSEICK